MKSKFVKRFLTMGLAAGLALSAVCGCAKQGGPADDAGKKEEGKKEEREAKDASFTWWIYKTDGEGTYYEDYKDNPQTLYENGVLMDLTEYVEKYMPNYLAYLDANPELKPFVQVQDEEGKTHYYALYVLSDGPGDSWQGICYRRDWVVKYAKPTEYVWDWESDSVKENGHPAVTPLARAVEEKNMDGWKKNEVKEFKADYGENPDED